MNEKNTLGICSTEFSGATVQISDQLNHYSLIYSIANVNCTHFEEVTLPVWCGSVLIWVLLLLFSFFIPGSYSEIRYYLLFAYLSLVRYKSWQPCVEATFFLSFFFFFTVWRFGNWLLLCLRYLVLCVLYFNLYKRRPVQPLLSSLLL